MQKKFVGIMTVVAVTFSVLGMGVPLENQGQVEGTEIVSTTDITLNMIESIDASQSTGELIQERGTEVVSELADNEAYIQDSTMPLVENVVEAQKRKTELTPEEIVILEKVVSAESRGESFEAQYSVACVILNRIESDMFPNTVEAVIRQSGQFSCVSHGNVIPVPITDSVREAVKAALDNNTLDPDILWFRSSYYHSFRTRSFQIGQLFFSSK